MRISTTTLESFRLFTMPDNDWMAEEELVATIRGEFRGNHKVWLGSAFGAVLEKPEAYRIAGGYRVENLRGCGESFVFGDDVVGEMLALIDRPNTVFEAKAVGRYGAHDVVAKADQVVGTRIVETKATLSTFDFDKYAESCQWQFMADIFGAASVTYRIACLSESERNGVIGLRSVESFTLYPFQGMREDLHALVSEFADYCALRGLTTYLDQRQREVA